MSTQTHTITAPSLETGRSRRLLSIDLLRGLTLGFMILVNDNGSEKAAYWALNHATWNGFTPTDLVFPTFLLLVGVTIVLSTAKRLEQGANKASLLLHVVKRAFILFLLGLVVNSSPFFHLDTMRYYGVLPRIALCYLIVATYYILRPSWRDKAWALAGCLVGYWALMRFVPVPGAPGAGIPTRDVPLLDPYWNIAAYTDRHIFSAPHLYEGTRDPEGLLSTIPALGTALIGLLTGLWLRSAYRIAEKAKGILVAAVACIALGVLWNFTFPINKRLWTSSYTLFAGGLSLLLIASFIWVADVRAEQEPATQRSPWRTFLLVFGTNAIFSYVLSEVLASVLDSIHIGRIGLHEWLYEFIHRGVADAAFASLLYSLAYVGLCWLIVYFALYRRKIFLKI